MLLQTSGEGSPLRPRNPVGPLEAGIGSPSESTLIAGPRGHTAGLLGVTDPEKSAFSKPNAAMSAASRRPFAVKEPIPMPPHLQRPSFARLHGNLALGWSAGPVRTGPGKLADFRIFISLLR